MKSTGIVRKLDDLGRICIPKSFRDANGIDANTPIELFSNGNTLMIKKYEKCCVFCGQIGDIEIEHGQYVCDNHLIKIKRSS